jgi:hypothetical protein
MTSRGRPLAPTISHYPRRTSDYGLLSRTHSDRASYRDDTPRISSSADITSLEASGRPYRGCGEKGASSRNTDFEDITEDITEDGRLDAIPRISEFHEAVYFLLRFVGRADYRCTEVPDLGRIANHPAPKRTLVAAERTQAVKRGWNSSCQTALLDSPLKIIAKEVAISTRTARPNLS